MGAPLVQQGTLNRLLASVVFADNATLNVTASFLAKEGISLAFEGDAGMLIPTLTGGVTSPEPYQIATITMNLVKSQALAELYKEQIEANVNVGDVSVIPDTTTLQPYQINNCVLKGVRDLPFEGTNAAFVVTMTGIYITNNNLWV